MELSFDIDDAVEELGDDGVLICLEGLVDGGELLLCLLVHGGLGGGLGSLVLLLATSVIQ